MCSLLNCLTNLHHPIHSNEWHAELFSEVVWEALWTTVIFPLCSSLWQKLLSPQINFTQSGLHQCSHRKHVKLNWSFLYRLHWVNLEKSSRTFEFLTSIDFLELNIWMPLKGWVWQGSLACGYKAVLHWCGGPCHCKQCLLAHVYLTKIWPFETDLAFSVSLFSQHLGLH